MRRAWLTIVLAAACATPPLPTPIEIPCVLDPPAPYPPGSSYLGVHANPGNNDVVACATGTAFVDTWHALEGLAMSQPNTFSPDGSVTYAATFNPDPAGCNVHAVRVDTGDVVWCRALPRSVGGSAVEVAADGNLYVTADRSVLSLHADGSDRWEAVVSAAGGEDFGDGPLGVHFTPDGHVATVTAAGVVLLLAREDGHELARLDLPAATGFVPPMALTGVDLSTLIPESVRADLESTFGTAMGGNGLASFLGASGNYSDNTIAVSSRNEIFVMGGGPDPMHGALQQIRIGGTTTAPTLEVGWATITNAGSATSPSISFDGRWVSTGDGASVNAILSPAMAHAHLYVMDVDACDANTDDDSDAARCAPRLSVELERGPIAGSPPLLPDGSLLFWELSVSQGLFGADARDIGFAAIDGTTWSATLPDGLEWTSVMTVTGDHILGTASVITPGLERIVTVRLPSHVESYVTVLDRADGHLVFRAPVPDDSTATVTVGPDGSLYVGMFGLLAILASDDHPHLGLVRFAPTAR
jgi:hypothetical protein